MNLEKRQKYFVNRQDAVTIRCKTCGRVGVFPVVTLKKQNHALHVNCLYCNVRFAVDLEFRSDYRIPINIPATYRAFSTPKTRARHCIVANQSSGGLLLRITEDVPVKKEDRLIVCYRQQTHFPVEIERVLSVRHYDRGHCIGGAFVNEPVLHQ